MRTHPPHVGHALETQAARSGLWRARRQVGSQGHRHQQRVRVACQPAQAGEHATVVGEGQVGLTVDELQRMAGRGERQELEPRDRHVHRERQHGPVVVVAGEHRFNPIHEPLRPRQAPCMRIAVRPHVPDAATFPPATAVRLPGQGIVQPGVAAGRNAVELSSCLGPRRIARPGKRSKARRVPLRDRRVRLLRHIPLQQPECRERVAARQLRLGPHQFQRLALFRGRPQQARRPPRAPPQP